MVPLLSGGVYLIFGNLPCCSVFHIAVACAFANIETAWQFRGAALEGNPSVDTPLLGFVP